MCSKFVLIFVQNTLPTFIAAKAVPIFYYLPEKEIENTQYNFNRGDL